MHKRSILMGTLAALLGLALAGAAAPHYEMSIALDAAAGTYEGTAAIAYTNETPLALDEIFLRLVPNGRDLFGAATLDVTAASAAGGAVDVMLYAEDTVLMVPLAAPLAVGETIELALAFRGRAADARGGFSSTSEYGLMTRSRDTLTLIGFYPLLAPYTAEGWALDPPAPLGDPLFAEAATYDVTLIVDPAFRVVPAPDTTTSQPDGRLQMTYHRAGWRDLSFVVLDAARAPREAVRRGVSVRAWFSDEHAEAGQRALDRGAAAIDVYSDLFGPLPFSSVDIVEAPLQRAAGVECTGLFLVAAASAANPRDPFFDVIVSHEMAHQWFYAAVGNDPIEEPWLDESLATYASWLFLARAVSSAAADAQAAASAAAYERARRAHPSLRVTSPVYDFADSDAYSSFVYSGGATELAALHAALGDDAFFGALQAYACAQAARIATGALWCQYFSDAGAAARGALCGR